MPQSTQRVCWHFARPAASTHWLVQYDRAGRRRRLSWQGNATGGGQGKSKNEGLYVRRTPADRGTNFHGRRESNRRCLATVLPVPNRCFTDLENCRYIRSSQEFQNLHIDQLRELTPATCVGGLARPRGQRTGSGTRRRSRASTWRARKESGCERLGNCAQNRLDQGTHAEFSGSKRPNRRPENGRLRKNRCGSGSAQNAGIFLLIPIFSPVFMLYGALYVSRLAVPCL
jgi:hypothetical protein